MALIIENGSLVNGANSYASDAEYVAYAAARGKVIGSTEAAREVELVKAMDYIERNRESFKGTKRERTQALQWPRYGVWVDGYYVDEDTIPSELKNAQLEAAIAATSQDLLITGTNSNVQSESIGQLSTSYFSGGSYESVRLDTVDAYLNVLLKRGTSGANTSVFRA